MKGKSKRIVSGFLSALTIISSIMQPVTTYAAEAEPAAYEAEYPDMEKVKGALAEDEIVTAEDYEVEAGTGFDVKSDFSGMKIHPEKVKVTYHEAKNQNGQAFDGNKADTYQLKIRRQEEFDLYEVDGNEAEEHETEKTVN